MAVYSKLLLDIRGMTKSPVGMKVSNDSSNLSNYTTEFYL